MENDDVIVVDEEEEIDFLESLEEENEGEVTVREILSEI